MSFIFRLVPDLSLTDWIGCVGELDPERDTSIPLPPDCGCVLEEKKFPTTVDSFIFRLDPDLVVWLDWIPGGGFLLLIWIVYD